MTSSIEQDMFNAYSDKASRKTERTENGVRVSHFDAGDVTGVARQTSFLPVASLIVPLWAAL
jgi:hypothetical protein